MSNALYPVLPGQAWPRVRTLKTQAVVKRANGRRYALSTQLYPTFAYRLTYNWLRPADLRTLGGFFLARGGQLDDFLFDDRDDNTATDQVFGLGDGVRRAWPLARAWGGAVQPVDAITGVPVIKVNGVVQSSGLAIAGGEITFAGAPAAGAVLSWTGQYLWRCFFPDGELDIEEFMRRLYRAKTVEFETFRP
jgi:hypothetical protein